MATAIVTAPAAEPLTTAEVSRHLRLDAGSVEAAPGAPTTVALAGIGAGNVDNGAHRYLLTFVTADGETQGGTPSASITVADKTVNGKVTVGGLPLGGSAVTGRKVYRTLAGGAAYFLHSAIDASTTTSITDNTADSSLGVGVPTTNTTGDPMLSMLITAARQAAETICRRALVTQQWRLVMDEFPRPSMNISSANWYGPQWGTNPGPLSAARVAGRSGYEIYLPLPPLQTVDSVTYYDQDGALQTLSADQYIVDLYSEPARLVPAYGVTWPTTQTRANAVEVKFTCGYGAPSAVPIGIKQWMLLRIGAMYENREEIVVANRALAVELPFVDRLLDSFRVLTF